MKGVHKQMRCVHMVAVHADRAKLLHGFHKPVGIGHAVFQKRIDVDVEIIRDLRRVGAHTFNLAFEHAGKKHLPQHAAFLGERLQFGAIGKHLQVKVHPFVRILRKDFERGFQRRRAFGRVMTVKHCQRAVVGNRDVNFRDVRVLQTDRKRFQRVRRGIHGAGMRGHGEPFR